MRRKLVRKFAGFSLLFALGSATAGTLQIRTDVDSGSGRCQTFLAIMKENHLPMMDDQQVCEFGASNYQPKVASKFLKTLDWQEDRKADPVRVAKLIYKANELPKDAERLNTQDEAFFSHVRDLGRQGHMHVYQTTIVLNGQSFYVLALNSDVCGKERYGVPSFALFKDETYTQPVRMRLQPLGIPMYIKGEPVIFWIDGDQWSPHGPYASGNYSEDIGLSLEHLDAYPDEASFHDYCAWTLFR
jgi:hypothetical protein